MQTHTQGSVLRNLRSVLCIFKCTAYKETKSFIQISVSTEGHPFLNKPNIFYVSMLVPEITSPDTFILLPTFLCYQIVGASLEKEKCLTA